MIEISVLSCVDLSYTVGQRAILKSLNLVVPNGITGLIGVNGAGKTTLLRAMCGIQAPTSGRVEHSQDIKLRMVPQELTRVPWLTSRSYLKYYFYLNSVTSRPNIDEMLESAGMGTLAGTNLRQLSGGELRKLALLAVSQIDDLGLLLLDEPTAQLDPLQRELIHAIIGKIAEKAAVVVSSHATEDIENIAPNVAVLSGGRIVYNSDIESLKSLTEAYPGRSILAKALEWANEKEEDAHARRA